ncbi:hypothetical protein RIF29_18928 [Crotalaria pallida]|uniref:Uncharacterized protein n=1 Tax=Crotalaria pallida TaxID=3830 RepID=A0AAN9F0U6_CROPI
MVAGLGVVAGSNWVGLGLLRLGDEEGRTKERHGGVRRRETERGAAEGGSWGWLSGGRGCFMKGWGEEEAPWRRLWWSWLRLMGIAAAMGFGLRGGSRFYWL